MDDPLFQFRYDGIPLGLDLYKMRKAVDADISQRILKLRIKSFRHCIAQRPLGAVKGPQGHPGHGHGLQKVDPFCSKERDLRALRVPRRERQFVPLGAQHFDGPVESLICALSQRSDLRAGCQIFDARNGVGSVAHVHADLSYILKRRSQLLGGGVGFIAVYALALGPLLQAHAQVDGAGVWIPLHVCIHDLIHLLLHLAL